MNTSSGLHLILTAVYYIVVLFFAVLGLFGVYPLSAHGRSRVISLVTSLVFVVVFLITVGAGQVILSSLS